MLPERSFTRRETEIILLAAEGYSNHEIARELLIAEEMVKGYMKELREKLAVRNRTHSTIPLRRASATE